MARRESYIKVTINLGIKIISRTNHYKNISSFRINFERSLVLRSELWNLVRLTQEAEQVPERPQIESLNKSLRDFMNGTINFLFYKDTETFERFVEEILVTKQNKDLVPILHRFGAYLETLFGQVGMRAVLEKHPFNAKN